MKSDVALPFAVPPRVRSWLALGLGIVLGVVQSLASGAPMVKALLDGLAAAVGAIAAHETIIESLRGGKEFFATSARTGLRPKPPSNWGVGPGAAAGFVLLVGLVATAQGSSGCTPTEKQIARSVVDI